MREHRLGKGPAILVQLQEVNLQQGHLALLGLGVPSRTHLVVHLETLRAHHEVDGLRLRSHWAERPALKLQAIDEATVLISRHDDKVSGTTAKCKMQLQCLSSAYACTS